MQPPFRCLISSLELEMRVPERSSLISIPVLRGFKGGTPFQVVNNRVMEGCYTCFGVSQLVG